MNYKCPICRKNPVDYYVNALGSRVCSDCEGRFAADGYSLDYGDIVLDGMDIASMLRAYDLLDKEADDFMSVADYRLYHKEMDLIIRRCVLEAQKEVPNSDTQTEE